MAKILRLALMVLLVMLAMPLAAMANDEQALIIFAEGDPSSEDRAIVFSIGGDRVATDGLSEYFRELPRDWRIQEAQVWVVLRREARIDDFLMARSILTAIGFVHVRYFAANERTGKMIEIKTEGWAIPVPR